MILLDLGGVLVDASFDEFSRLISQPMDMETFRNRWLSSKAVRDFEVGHIDPPTFGSRFVDEWDLAMPPEHFVDVFASWPAGPYAGAASLVQRLRDTHRVGCFSNCNELHWQRFGPFLHWFDVAISSHEIGRVKPDPEAFAVALERTGASAQETWFFDDSPRNVESANAFGMRAVLVRGLHELEVALARNGLLPAQI